MKLKLETYRATESDDNPKEMGRSSIEIGEEEYLLLQDLENKLQASGASKAVEEIDAGLLNFDPPDDCGDLADCKVQVYLGEEAEAGHFHLVARRVADDSQIHTNSIMLRMVAI